MAPTNTIETTIAVSKAGGFQGLRNCQELRFSWLDAHLKRQHGPAVKIPLNNPYWGTLKGWKVVVPKAHSFDDPERTLRLLSEILQPEPYVRRLNKLRVDRRWMERIADGDLVVVEFDDWVNKSLPRYQGKRPATPPSIASHC